MSLPIAPFPRDASTIGPQVDHLFFAMLGLCSMVAVSIGLLMLLFLVRYRRGRRADRSNAPTSLFWLEVSWAGIPLALFLVIFVWSTRVYSRMHAPPPDAQPIYVLARQWMWQIQHVNGRREINVLHVPLGHPVRLIMTSQDVIHDFYVPAFRLKQDVLPGRFTTLWFTPTELGSFRLFCAQFCGPQHYAMDGQVIVMRPNDYAQWLTGGGQQPTMVARGAAIFRQAGCSGCHTPGASVHAPDLRHVYERRVHLSNGRTVTADENYLLDSILEPDAQRVAGYAPIMPNFKDELTQGQLDALISYLKSGEAP
jgi:cytochrome c oxidase subunit II